MSGNDAGYRFIPYPPIPAAAGGTGTVTNIATAVPITGGPITTTGTIGVTDFVASGASHARGTVPDPGAVAGTSKFLREDATWATPAAGAGTVTSVAQTVPSAEFAIAGSPVTGSGTLAISKQTQSAATAWAGPVSGAAAQPTFRALLMSDIPQSWLYGSGADGAFTADGVATATWAALSGSTYTLNRNVALTTLTVNAGIIIKPNGWAIFCSVALANNGTITVAGGDASSNTAGAGGGGTNLYNAGTSGGNGGGNGTVGGTSVVTSTSIGGSGGNGGAGAASAGGVAGTANVPANNLGGVQFAFSMFACLTGRALDSTKYGAGSGGGGGGSAGSASFGGGGGGGGGIMGLFAKTISGSGTITAKGGNAGLPGGANGGGGGGGGGGGVIFLITSTGNYASLNTVTAAAGTHTNFSVAAANGVDGAAGIVVAAIL